MDASPTVYHMSSSRQQNTVCRLQMWLDGRSDLNVILQSLSDPAIQFLDLYMRESFLLSHSTDQIQEIMKVVGALPKLERLDISCPYTSTTDQNQIQGPLPSLPVSAIQWAFTPQLTHLLLVNVRLSGNYSDFESFGQAAQALPRLHCVVLAEVQLLKYGHPNERSTLMDAFVRALACVSSLGHVVVSGSEDLGVLQPSTLTSFQSPLRDLCLSQLALTTAHLQAIAQNHQGMSNLRELDLQCQLSVEGAHALAHILENNKSLEELTLRLTTDTETFRATPRTAAAHAVLAMQAAAEEEDDDTVDETDAPSVVVIPSDPREDMEYRRNVVLAAAVVRSKRLTSFELESANLSTPTLLEPFHHMLRDNYSLEDVQLHCSVGKGYCLESEIAFYTRLNHLGRAHLFQCPHCSHCDEAYVSMLDSLKHDLSAFYYFLSRKPSLLATGFPCPAKVPATRKVLGKRKRLYRAVKYNGVSYKN